MCFFDFNKGEFFAFKSANGLKQYLQWLRSRTELSGYQINIYAHSQGNIVASEAAASGGPFDTYILAQAAAPAHSYYSGAPVKKSLEEKDRALPTPFNDTDGGYNGIFSSIQGLMINHVNPADFALETGRVVGFEANWVQNQLIYKPFRSWSANLSWDWDLGTRQSWRELKFSSPGAAPVPPPPPQRNLVDDRQEIRAFVARSRTSSLGASLVGGPSQGSIDRVVNLNLSFQFSNTRPEHSAQFTRPVQKSSTYWQQVRQDIGDLF